MTTVTIIFKDGSRSRPQKAAVLRTKSSAHVVANYRAWRTCHPVGFIVDSELFQRGKWLKRPTPLLVRAGEIYQVRYVVHFDKWIDG